MGLSPRCPRGLWVWAPARPQAHVFTAHCVLSPQLQQRQAARLLAQMLSRACFHQWRRQVGVLEKPSQSCLLTGPLQFVLVSPFLGSPSPA